MPPSNVSTSTSPGSERAPEGLPLAYTGPKGVGIAADELERIFDRFYRGKNSRPSEGMGLGLSIARHIARQHGGDVQVESKVGEGSRFIVSLPVIK
jgi:signal transduction histidine kinase